MTPSCLLFTIVHLCLVAIGVFNTCGVDLRFLSLKILHSRRAISRNMWPKQAFTHTLLFRKIFNQTLVLRLEGGHRKAWGEGTDEESSEE